MMNVPYESFLSSKPFSVKGPDGKSFYVHGGLIAQHSKVLAIQVEGATLENKKKRIEIEDIDGDLDDATVMRFIEYAYTGEYTVPEPDKEAADESPARNGNITPNHYHGQAVAEDAPAEYLPIEEAPAEEASAEIELAAEEDAPPEDTWGFGTRLSKKYRKKKRASNLWLEREKEEEAVADPVETVRRTPRAIMWLEFEEGASIAPKEVWKPRVNEDPCEAYSKVLLSHARLYVFSSRYECEDLMLLCLQKLRLTLLQFQLHSSRTKDIADLIEYTYRHTMHYESGFDKLRLLVLQYVVLNIELIMEDEGFKQLLQESGPLAADLMVKILERLN